MPNLKFGQAEIVADNKVRNLSREDRLSRDELIRALQEYQQRFHHLVEGSLQGVMVTQGAKPVFANQALAGMFGYTIDEILGLDSWEKLVAPGDRERVLAFCSARAKGEPAPSHYDYQAVRKDGSLFWLENLSRQVNWDGGAAVQSTVIDITARKSHEMELMDARQTAEDASRAKSEFLATMTHEFRTPLNAIIGFSDLLRNGSFEPGNEEALKGYAEDVYLSGQHMLSLVNDVLDITAIESGKRGITKTPVVMEASVKDAVRTFEVMARDKDIRMELDLPDELPTLQADERACMQVFQNLLSNAVKYTDPGGTVRVTAAATDEALTVSIADTGHGIPADKLAAITEPFTQVHTDPHLSANSTGLGLAIVKSLMEAHGGALAIESEVGLGTTVSVSFPR